MDEIAVWFLTEDQYPEYQANVTTGDAVSYEYYCARIEAIKRIAKEKGIKLILVPMTVKKMKIELEKLFLPWTPDNCSRIVGEYYIAEHAKGNL